MKEGRGNGGDSPREGQVHITCVPERGRPKRKGCDTAYSTGIEIDDSFLGMEIQGELLGEEEFPVFEDLPRMKHFPEGEGDRGRRGHEDSEKYLSSKREWLAEKEALWVGRRKRKNNPFLWQHIQSNQELYPGVIHPSRYSSVDFVQGVDKGQKMYLGIIKNKEEFPEKANLNTVLPLYLNATTDFESETHFEEFSNISANFMERVSGIDYSNVTVQQLKGIMKEFGLNHTGKKIDLIGRLKKTCEKIYIKKESEKKRRGGPKRVEQKEEAVDSGDSMSFLFF
jgi:SAP domain